MESEERYLYAAVEKTGSVILVRQFNKSESFGHRKVIYLSPNADILGVNTDTINRGYRLPEDYIHPEDRAGFIEEIHLAFKKGTDFSDEVRIIGDDGKLRRVNVDVIMLSSTEDYIEVEFVIRRAVRFVANHEEDEVTSEDTELQSDVKITPEFITENRADDYFNCFADACELYTAVLDINGHKLAEPRGPKAYIGEFYEMLVNPQYGKVYDDIKKSLTVENSPIFLQLDAAEGGQDGRIAAAPIIINGIYCATWILYAHTANQAQKLFKVHRLQWEICDAISDHLSRLYNRLMNEDKERARRDALEFEIKEKKIITTMLSGISGGEDKDFSKAFRLAGRLLGVDYVVYYACDETCPDKMNLVNYWAKSGQGDDAEKVFGWQHDHYDEEFQRLIFEDGIVVDRRNMTNRMRVEVFEGNARAVLVYPLRVKGNYVGRLIFIENTKERIWTEAEVGFAREMSRIISKGLEIRESGEKSVGISDQLLSIFNYIEMDLFVRENSSGRILYASDSLNEKLGGGLEGKDSYRLIPHAADEVQVLLPDPTLVKGANEPAVYRRYINDLGNIYDVTEIGMVWTKGEEATAVVLMPAGN